MATEQEMFNQIIKMEKAILCGNKWSKLWHLVVMSWWFRIRARSWEHGYLWKALYPSLRTDVEIIKAIVSGKI